jgi:pimeloyl-ACP methyl ester carboxylesterase
MVSKHADLDGPVHYLDFGGSGAPLVCVHGLSGAALNWMAVAPALAERHRVFALDLRGFGRTPLGPGTRLRDNRRLLDRFLREVAGAPAIVVGNSMGGLLAVLQAARVPASVAGLVLVDPALPWHGLRPFDLSLWTFFGSLLPPLLGEASLGWSAERLGAERVVRGVIDACCVDSRRVPEDMVRALIDQETERFANPRSFRALAQASRSLLWALASLGLTGNYGRVAAPTLVITGAGDRLVPASFSVAIARRFGWQAEVLPDVGHVPMMEAPADFLRITLGWLDFRAPAAA